ncbi:MAG TPA: metalloregulator ArsR/SmtB family transcription factor [Acetobacteraceae bacterium]|nr:metalloregulator ArsR/SmtB family transcription factor [Acetobacteraceae bacterium]
MEDLLIALRAAAEPTRLRVLSLAAQGMFCAGDFTEILDQSQPRLSRHLKLLVEAGLLARLREGAHVWFGLPEGAGGSLAREIVARLPAEEPVLEADRRQAARVLAERARIATETFRKQGADWDEMRALDLPAAEVERILAEVLRGPNLGRLIDIGTGTGRVLELLAPRISAGLGIDASPAMLSLARARLSRPEFAHCAVRRADMYRLPLADGSFDAAVLQMVLHHAEAPEAVIAEAARVLKPHGRLVIVELEAHAQGSLTQKLAHRWTGFAADRLGNMMRHAGLMPDGPVKVAGKLPLLVWSATRLAAPAAASPALHATL